MNETSKDKVKASWTKLTKESIDQLEADTVKAIAFAEVGANGNSDYLCLICSGEGRPRTIYGHFGFEAFGKRYSRDVDIEVVAEKVPFLILFVGTSPETTIRGNFAFEKGQWIHLSAGLGNHFFIRSELFGEFRRVLSEQHVTSLCCGGIEAALEVVGRIEAPSTTNADAQQQ